jgi:hypothetical protein
MSYSSYSPATIKAYVSGLSVGLKSRRLEDTPVIYNTNNDKRGKYIVWTG